jgi:hypothetical protein
LSFALFATPNHRFSRLDTTAAFQAATSATSNYRFNRTLPNHKTHVFNFEDCIKFIRLIIYHELSLYYHLFEGVCFSRCRPKIVRSLIASLGSTVSNPVPPRPRQSEVHVDKKVHIVVRTICIICFLVWFTCKCTVYNYLLFVANLVRK